MHLPLWPVKDKPSTARDGRFESGLAITFGVGKDRLLWRTPPNEFVLETALLRLLS